MDVDLALLADAATIDASGKLNVLGVFDRIAAAEFPAKHGRVSLVLRFSAGLEDAGKHELAIRLRDPSGGEVVGLNGSIKLGAGPASSGGRVKVPRVLNLDGLVFEEPGPYTFEVLVDGELFTSIPLNLVQNKAPRSQA